MAAPSLLIAAPSSGSGKTVITLALLRAFKNRGLGVTSFKIGPDYIDPAFHALATNRECFNLDPWAMSDETLIRNASRASLNSSLVIGEAVMGLFDGSQNGDGSSADLGEFLDIPIILVVDAKGQAASVGAVLHGFNSYRPGTKISGVIFNSVGSSNHSRMLGAAASDLGIPVLGYIPKSPDLKLEHRHLGLVQARENVELEAFLNNAANLIDQNIDLKKLQAIASPFKEVTMTGNMPPSPGQRISVAHDDAFAFCYPHLIADWKDAGAEVTFFSPLNDEKPHGSADFIYLPGGYPELFAEKLSNARNFKNGMLKAADKGTSIFGECGGYMTLGKALTDASGTRFPMLGLLPVETSFAKPKLHLGYRNATLVNDSFLGKKGDLFKAHEFHYASITSEEDTNSLFSLTNAKDEDLGFAGCVNYNVAGSFIHLIDRGTHD